MGKDLADAFPVAKSVFGEVDAALGTDLSKLCFEGPAEELTATRNAQPALFAVEYALAALTESYGVTAAVLAGHSIGEYVAATLAGVFDLPTAITAVSAGTPGRRAGSWSMPRTGSRLMQRLHSAAGRT